MEVNIDISCKYLSFLACQRSVLYETLDILIETLTAFAVLALKTDRLTNLKIKKQNNIIRKNSVKWKLFKFAWLLYSIILYNLVWIILGRKNNLGSYRCPNYFSIIGPLVIPIDGYFIGLKLQIPSYIIIGVDREVLVRFQTKQTSSNVELKWHIWNVKDTFLLYR